MGSSESLVQHVKVSHAIEQRQHEGLGPNRCGEGVDGSGKIICLATQQNEIEGVADILGEYRCGLTNGNVPTGAFDDQTGVGELLSSARPDQKGDVPTRLQ